MMTPRPMLALRSETSRESTISKNGREPSEPIMDYPPTTRIEERPAAISAAEAVALALAAEQAAASQSAGLLQTHAKSSNRTSPALNQAPIWQIAAAPTPCGNQQKQQQQKQQQQEQSLKPPQQGQDRKYVTDTPPLQLEPRTGPSANLSHPAQASYSPFPATADSTWRCTVAKANAIHGSWNAAATTTTAPTVAVQPQYLCARLPAGSGVPQPRPWQQLVPERSNVEEWKSFVTPPPLPCLADELLPPMEFRFYKEAGTSVTSGRALVTSSMRADNLPNDDLPLLSSHASVTSSMEGDNLPKDDHPQLPRFPPACPVTFGDRHNYYAHARALSLRSAGSEAGAQIRGQQQVQDPGEQLEHVRSMALDLASTVHELVEMQRLLSHQLQEVKLQAAQSQQQLRSSSAQIMSSQKSPPIVAGAPLSYDAQVSVQRPSTSSVSSPQLDCRAHVPQNMHHEVPMLTPLSQHSTVWAARNLGYSDTQDLLDKVHGHALEGLGSLQDWVERATHSFVTDNEDLGGTLCCQRVLRQPRASLTRL